MSIEMRKLELLHVFLAMNRVHDLQRSVLVLVRQQTRQPFDVLIGFVGETQSAQGDRDQSTARSSSESRTHLNNA